MIAGFKRRFVPKIRRGFKRHTIRRGRRWRAGMRMDLYENVRQKDMKLIFRAPVVKVEDITIHVGDPFYSERNLMVFIEEHLLADDELDEFAVRDGFEGLGEMGKFWHEEHGLGMFSGQVIHWDYDKRVV